MTFFLFLMVNATLFIRPAEIVPALIGLPIYNVLISLCLVASSGRILGQLSGPSLRDNPLTVCVFGIYLAIILSLLVRMDFEGLSSAVSDFGKVVLYYVLLISIVDTPTRLRQFLWAVAVFTMTLTVIALLQYHEYINIEAITPVLDMEINPATGEEYAVMRMCSTGIYNDPNDLCLILLVGMGICLYGAGDLRIGPLRLLWYAPLVLFGYALMMTHSRGGFLAMLAAMMVLFHARFGARKAAVLAFVAVPPALILFGGRQTNINLGGDTGQDRIQLWAEGFGLLKRSPIFGIGYGKFSELMGLVAHNSYVHGFTELGFFGGFLFFGAFYFALSSLYGIAKDGSPLADPELARLRPYLTAILAAYMAGIATISRNYIVPTYMILGLVAIYVRLATAGTAIATRKFDAHLLRRFAAVGAAFLVAAELFIRVFARYG